MGPDAPRTLSPVHSTRQTDRRPLAHKFSTTRIRQDQLGQARESCSIGTMHLKILYDQLLLMDFASQEFSWSAITVFHCNVKDVKQNYMMNVYRTGQVLAVQFFSWGLMHGIGEGVLSNSVEMDHTGRTVGVSLFYHILFHYIWILVRYNRYLFFLTQHTFNLTVFLKRGKL